MCTPQSGLSAPLAKLHCSGRGPHVGYWQFSAGPPPPPTPVTVAPPLALQAPGSRVPSPTLPIRTNASLPVHGDGSESTRMRTVPFDVAAPTNTPHVPKLG